MSALNFDLDHTRLHEQLRQSRLLRNIQGMTNKVLTLEHNLSGFFSCCNIKLESLYQYFTFFKHFPREIDERNLFRLYQSTEIKNISLFLFEDKNKVDLHLPSVESLKCLEPFSFDWICGTNVPHNLPLLFSIIEKYFTPNDVVNYYINKFETKYNVDYALIPQQYIIEDWTNN